MSSNGEIFEDRVEGLGVGSDGSGLEVLDELPEAEGFASGAKRLFDLFDLVDGSLGVVGAVEVPSEEAGEVLDCAESLVAADWILVSATAVLTRKRELGVGGWVYLSLLRSD